VYYDRNNNNEKKEITEWHNIVLWRGLAETAQKYVKKGRQLYIEGRIQTRSYEKDGQKLYFTEIIANNMMFLGKKEEGQDAQPQSQPQPAAAAAPVANQTSPAASPVDNLIDSKPDGDLPF
jgi:single-strand DNA-binding protein